MIDKHRVVAHRRERAVRAQRHRRQVVVITDAREHRIGALGRCGRRIRDRPAIFLGPGVGLGQRPVEHGNIMPRLDKMSRHGPAHDARSDECQFCHGDRA